MKVVAKRKVSYECLSGVFKHRAGDVFYCQDEIAKKLIRAGKVKKVFK